VGFGEREVEESEEDELCNVVGVFGEGEQALWELYIFELELGS